jgi:hypothetical protein
MRLIMPNDVFLHATVPMNIQIAATLGGRLAAVGPIPVHGARHDAHAFVASELKVLLVETSVVADLGYVGVEGIEIVPFKRPPGGELTTNQADTEHP